MTARVALALLATAAAAAPAPPRAPEPVDREIAAAIDLVYGLDFDKARQAAAALEARHPEHPSGPLLAAVVAYQRWTAAGLPRDGSWEAVDRDLERTIAAAKALAKASPAESRYYFGAALGFRARGLAAQRHFVRAVPSAAASLRQLKGALALDPGLMDARLGLGMYHYFAARMPAGARPFAHLLIGEPGDRSRGLAELWSVANSSASARMEARAVLSMILSKDDEQDWTGAEKLLAELMRRYPRNPLYRLRRTFVAERRGDLERAAALADPDSGWIESVPPAVRARARAQALYRAAEIALLRGRIDEAAKRLGALDDAMLPGSLRDWALLRRANLRDALGEREGARGAYARVKDKRAAELAREWRKVPFPGGPREAAPFFSGY